MKLVVLGRDGVVNQASPDGIQTPDGWEALSGSLEAIARLNHADYRVAMVSNQPGLATGKLDLDRLNDIHQKIHRQLARVGGHVDGIFFCPHADDSQCSCRMPSTGLLEQVLERFDISADDACLISGKDEELEAAHRCKISTLSIGAESHAKTQNDVFASLSEAVEAILKED